MYVYPSCTDGGCCKRATMPRVECKGKSQSRRRYETGSDSRANSASFGTGQMMRFTSDAIY